MDVLSYSNVGEWFKLRSPSLQHHVFVDGQEHERGGVSLADVNGGGGGGRSRLEAWASRLDARDGLKSDNLSTAAAQGNALLVIEYHSDTVHSLACDMQTREMQRACSWPVCLDKDNDDDTGHGLLVTTFLNHRNDNIPSLPFPSASTATFLSPPHPRYTQLIP
jgi:hypothetical protein